jgi:hypothetical protein
MQTSGVKQRGFAGDATREPGRARAVHLGAEGSWPSNRGLAGSRGGASWPCA